MFGRLSHKKRKRGKELKVFAGHNMAKNYLGWVLEIVSKEEMKRCISPLAKLDCF